MQTHPPPLASYSVETHHLLVLCFIHIQNVSSLLDSLGLRNRLRFFVGFRETKLTFVATLKLLDSTLKGHLLFKIYISFFHRWLVHPFLTVSARKRYIERLAVKNIRILAYQAKLKTENNIPFSLDLSKTLASLFFLM